MPPRSPLAPRPQSHLSGVGRSWTGHGGGIHHVLLDVGDGAGGPYRGHRHGARADAVLHVQSNQALPGQDIIVEAIEEVHLNSRDQRSEITQTI